MADAARSGRRYDVDHLVALSARLRRQGLGGGAAGPRPPVEHEPYTLDRLRVTVTASVRDGEAAWAALHTRMPSTLLHLVRLTDALHGLLARWGLYASDVRDTTPGPERDPAGAPVPGRSLHHVRRGAVSLTAAAARLGRTLVDAARPGKLSASNGYDAVLRERQALAKAIHAAPRLLRGGPYRLPSPPVALVGTRRSWWAVVGGVGLRLDRHPDARYRIRHGALLAPYAERARADGDLLGPFATERQATDAAKRAVATPKDYQVGLFAPATSPP
jgi:hypothetical protein